MPDTQIIVLTMQNDSAFARAALRAGAVGYVLKEAADAELMTAVLAAAEGRTYLNPELGAKLAVQPPEGAARPDGLSPREIEVLRLIALGHTNTEIAKSLFLSVRTVESHRSRIQHKVGVTTRAELVGYARQRGLLD
jgi:two-component system, NarL family, response regulator NreC